MHIERQDYEHRYSGEEAPPDCIYIKEVSITNPLGTIYRTTVTDSKGRIVALSETLSAGSGPSSLATIVVALMQPTKY